HATPVTNRLQATSGAGTNIGGANLELNGGLSTGSGAGGSVVLSTAAAGGTGTAENALSARLSVDSTGAVSFLNRTLYPYGGFLYVGSTTNDPIKATAAATNGQILIGSNGADPVAGSITVTATGGGVAPVMEPSSKVPVTSGSLFENVHVSAGSGHKYFAGLGI